MQVVELLNATRIGAAIDTQPHICGTYDGAHTQNTMGPNGATGGATRCARATKIGSTKRTHTLRRKQQRQNAKVCAIFNLILCRKYNLYSGDFFRSVLSMAGQCACAVGRSDAIRHGKVGDAPKRLSSAHNAAV